MRPRSVHTIEERCSPLAVGHRQDGERPAGQELFLRHAAMRLRVARHQHDGDLIVRPGARADAGILAHRAEAALGRGDEARRYMRPLFSLTRRVPGRARCRALRRARSARPWDRLSRRSRARAQEAVLDDPAHRGGSLPSPPLRHDRSAGKRGGAAVAAGVGDADVEDRLGVGHELAPRRPAPRKGAGWCRRSRWCGRRRRPPSARSGTRSIRAVNPDSPAARRQKAAVQAGTDDGKSKRWAVRLRRAVRRGRACAHMGQRKGRAASQPHVP